MMLSNLRAKILFTVGVTLFIVLGTNTLVHIRDLKQDYLASIKWRSEALAQGILNQVNIYETQREHGITSIQNLFESLFFHSLHLYNLYKEKDVTHVALIDEYGRIVTHNDRAFVGTSLENAKLLRHIQRREQAVVLDGNTYHTLVPVYVAGDVYVGSIDIGVPKTIVDDKIRRVLVHAVFLFVLFLIASLVAVSLFIHLLITRPVKYLIALGNRLSEGRLIYSFCSSGRNDEIGALGVVFSQISMYFQNIAEIASRIATGVLADEVNMRSAQDVLGNAVQEMLHSLRNIATVMTNIAEGDLTETIRPRSEADAFGKVIQTMTEGLQTLIRQIRSSAEQISATGTTISSLAASDIHLVQNVNTSMKEMMQTMLTTGNSVEDVALNMEILSSSVEETSASVAQMTSSISGIAHNTNALTDRTHVAIQSIDQAVKTVKEVVQSTEISKQLSQHAMEEALNGQQAVEKVMTGMETIRQTITTGVETINRFAQRSGEINTILDVIRDITDQTSLLALNASIIAAQAGSHGRSFAVVADEIKSLADGVKTSTKDIATILSTLQKDTTQVVRTIHEGAEDVEQGMQQTRQARTTLEQIIKSAQRSSSLVTDIAEALDGLMDVTYNVTNAMEDVTSMTDDIRLATNEQTSSTHQINKAIEHVNEMTSHIQQAATDQLSGVHQMLNAANHVNSLIQKNLDSTQQIVKTTEILSSESEALLNSVDRFKLSD